MKVFSFFEGCQLYGGYIINIFSLITFINHYISHVNWNCEYKSQEEGQIFIEITQWKFLAGTELEPSTYWSRSSLLYSSTFLTGFGQFHGATISGPFKWPVLRGGMLISSRLKAVWNTVQSVKAISSSKKDRVFDVAKAVRYKISNKL